MYFSVQCGKASSVLLTVRYFYEGLFLHGYLKILSASSLHYLCLRDSLMIKNKSKFLSKFNFSSDTGTSCYVCMYYIYKYILHIAKIAHSMCVILHSIQCNGNNKNNNRNNNKNNSFFLDYYI